jgi:chromosome segregation ATPase
MIDNLLEEIDSLKEQATSREMKLQTLNFRFEKLQEDITKKHEMISSLKNHLSEKNEIIQNLTEKLNKAERENKLTKEDISPRLDALKSRYEVCMLEMVSMENDNKLLSDRIDLLTKENNDVRKKNRNLKRDNSEEKLQRLHLCKEFEKVKRDFETINEKLEDIKLEKEEVEEINKRLKNEKDLYFKKLEILERENTQLKIKNIPRAFSSHNRSPKSQVTSEIKKREVDQKDTVFLSSQNNFNNDFAQKLQNFEKKSNWL